MSGPEEVRVQLARMEGKQDITNERLETSNKINDERHAVTKAQLAHHNERIGVLEADRHVKAGERRGLSTAGRIAWAGIGLIPGGAIVAALMRLFGA
jgi:hypothetical protein